MTTGQRDAIASPASGLIIYNTTTNSLEIRNSSAWVSLSPAADAMPTIQIGTQKWMSKNLDVAFYRNGDPIPQVTDPTAWANLTTGAWCYYNNDPIQGGKFGKLYNWYAINDPRGLAPQGWHIPNDEEWTTLETTLGGSSVAGGKMKEAGSGVPFNWQSPNTAADNSSGWAGLPGGYRVTNGFFDVGFYGNWWSSTEGSTTTAWLCNLRSGSGSIFRDYLNRRNGFSVRCLRD
ncbi:MAG: fibrobacter succinogenes major paralogous domain-containing protein [Saprospiraceae bacterium]|nr:fibrobacter succinogenes major paralogous domain-containing protein [Saprospiraceae bacterium]MBK8370827.1 fibrobacter succinogenes major paralogous domain-containing protein [Saprospiraceae bacterium]MBK8546130.1 fibrobacter succinogenes major paralogous domain-containing protein [Saprospiraceae bacterium]MBK9044870.1 fibrobacter succinogenes major paralogous domain-containing protein [Saprospiraceae bacterium]